MDNNAAIRSSTIFRIRQEKHLVVFGFFGTNNIQTLKSYASYSLTT